METKQQKIEKIRQFCIAANESIKDLTIGCEVILYDAKVTIVKMLENHPFQCSFYYTRYNRDFMAPEGAYEVQKENLEIIGREIHLADVLLAINKIDTYCIRSDSDFLKFDEDSRRYISFGVSWDLTKTLSDQPEPTLDFIISLIP